MKTLLSLLFMAALLTGAAAADAGRSTGTFAYRGDALHGQSRFHWKDLDALLSLDVNRDGDLSDEEMDAARALLVDFGEMLYDVKRGNMSIPVARTMVAQSLDGTLVFEFEFEMPKESRAEELQLEFAAASDFPLLHQHALQVADAHGKVLFDDVSAGAEYRPLFPEAETWPDEVRHQLIETAAATSTETPAPAWGNTRPASAAIRGCREFSGLWYVLAVAAGWFGRHVLVRTQD